MSNKDTKVEFCDEDVDTPDFVDISNLHEVKTERNEVKIEDAEWKCSPCNKIFINELSQKIHEMLHSTTNYCFLCKRVIIRDFYKHVESQHTDLVCHICNKMCTFKKSLAIHIRSHTKERIFKCDKCDKSYMQRGALGSHIKSTHQGIKPFVCKICQGTFTTSSSLKKHLRRKHSKKEVYQCRTCSQEFSDKNQKHEHEATHLKSPICDECGQQFRTKYHFYMHLKEQHTKTAKCVHCKKFFYKSMLEAHMQEIHQPRTCEFCHYVFYSSRELTFHLVNHRQTCKICNKEYSQKNLAKHLELHRGNKMGRCKICLSAYLDIEKHNLTVHRNTKYIFCHLCPKKFLSKARKTNHMLREHLKEIGKRKCTSCGKLLASVSELKRHLLLHSDSYPYKCLLCDSVFKYSDTFEKHKEQSHSTHSFKKESRFTCESCGKKYTNDRLFKNHKCPKPKNAHTCNLCSFKCNNFSYFKKHLSIYHKSQIASECESARETECTVESERKVFECKICSDVFESKMVLDAHICNMLTTRKFRCPMCHKYCRVKVELVKHMKEQHPDKTIACKICGFKFISLICLKRHVRQVHDLIHHKMDTTDPSSNNGILIETKIEVEKIKVEKPIDLFLQ